MNIQSTQPIFTARNPNIRQTDKNMRNLMQEYPAFSTSRVKYYDSFQKQKPKVLNKVLPIYWKLDAERRELSKFDGITFINKTLEMVKRGKNAKFDDLSTFSKKAIIVDPWGGFCDYVSNAFNKYKDIFLRNLKQEEENATKRFMFEEKKPMNITLRTCNSISHKHPELVAL